MNSLLDFAGLPKFHSFSPELVKPAIDELIADAERVVGQVTAANEAPTWANVVTPIDDVTEKLGRAWGVVGHLNAVVNSPALRDAYNGMLPTITQFWTQLSQNEALFTKYKQIRTSSDTFAANGTPVGDFGGDLTAAQIRALDNEIRDFRLGGAELSAEKKAKFQAIQEELSTLMSKFNDNVLDATNAFGHVVVDQSELAGLPADVIQAASESAKADGQAGWKFTLQAPSYMPVMQYADHQPLRELMYRAYVTRASELGAKIEWDNSAVIKRILELRKESASLLGYKNYAEVSLSAKMAETPGDVVNFLNEMASKSRPFAEQDWQELTAFASDHFNMSEVNAWYVGYVSEKLRQQ
ncbi:MAG: oligopeptidase A, partial [Rhodocyclaceae bacterium]|nr:oligopeptidase A [Rhodocyclaceae bacterium]